MDTPCSVEPVTMQSPKQDCTQPHEIDPAPHVFFTHMAETAPPAVTTQISPEAQVCVDGVEQCTVPQAALVTVHCGVGWAVESHEAMVRPAPAQSS